MKKIYIYFILLLAAFTVTTCVLPLEEERVNFGGSYGIDLSVFCTTPGTKATVDYPSGVDSLNENKVNYVDWFIFKSENDTDGAFLSGHSPITQTSTGGALQTDDLLIKESVSFDSYVNEYGNSFYVYTIANLPSEYSYDEENGIMKGETVIGKTLTALRGISLKTAFDELDNGKFKVQDCFVMSGGEAFTFGEDDKNQVKKVKSKLERVAAKITIKLNIAPALDELHQMPNGDMQYIKTWYPVLAPVTTPKLNGVQVYMSFVNSEGEVGMPQLAETADWPSYDMDSFFTYNRYAFDPRYSYKGTDITSPVPSTSVPDTTPVWTDDDWAWTVVGTPFYSYPMQWDMQSAQAPFIKIILYWRPYEETDTEHFVFDEEHKLIHASRGGATATNYADAKEFYYKLMLPDLKIGEEQKGCKLLSNEWYELTYDVSILGGASDDLPLELRGQYCVADWSDPHVQGGGSLVQGSYLDTDFDVYYIYGGDDITIPVKSSHDLENTTANPTKVLGVDFTDYSSQTPRHYTYPTGTYTNGLSQKPLNINTTISGVQFDRRPKVEYTNGDDHSITFTHTLVSDISASTTTGNNPPDVSVYEFTVQISNSAGKTKTIKIIQYPPLMIENDRNPGNNNGNILINYYYYNSWRNGYYYSTTSSGRTSLGGINGLGSGTNNNRNMYIITTKVAPNNLLIADTRSTTINNDLGSSNNNWSSPDGTIYGGTGTRRLSYYYPADDSELAKSKIAPKFRIASSYGRTDPLSFDNARKRCASYQEDGIPAGRWRIPTKAEIEYIIKLSTIEVIPSLFEEERVGSYSEGAYFSADGGVVYPWTNGTVGYKTKTEVQNGSEGARVTNWVRCVYDEWYWGESKSESRTNKTTFYWGDKQM